MQSSGRGGRACGTRIRRKPRQAGEGAPAAEPPPPPVTPADAPPMTTYDPWGRLNRFTYRFNARFDEAMFLPVANGYRRLPSPMRSGVHNFFGNLPRSTASSITPCRGGWAAAYAASAGS